MKGIYVGTFLLIMLVHFSARAQTDFSQRLSPDIPIFYADALNFISDDPDSSRMDVYVEVPYESMHFTKENDAFRSKYEVMIEVHDSTDRLVQERWWTESVEVKSYEESVSPKIGNLTHRSFTLYPGNFSVLVQIKDAETEKTARVRKRVTLENFSALPFSVSDVMLVNRVDTVLGRKEVYPNISGNVGDLLSGFTMFFETYNKVGADSEQVFVSIKDVRGEAVQGDTFMIPLRDARVSCFHQEETKKLLAGDYILELKAFPKGLPNPESAKGIEANTSRLFVVRWRNLPVSITDLDMAIEQLVYVAEKNEIDAMKDAPLEKKRKLFADFWKKRDPTPNTDRNELMEEYYARVGYADKHFSHFTSGWKTDMGMVYIIFGPPNNIERHPFEIDSKPYEVWTYYDQNRQFVFIDQTGFGDYRLQTPIWDVDRTRIR